MKLTEILVSQNGSQAEVPPLFECSPRKNSYSVGTFSFTKGVASSGRVTGHGSNFTGKDQRLKTGNKDSCWH